MADQDYNGPFTGAQVDQALQQSLDLLTGIDTNSTTAYGDEGNGVSAPAAATAIKGAVDGAIGVLSTEVTNSQGINVNMFARGSNTVTSNLPEPANSYNMINMASSPSTNTVIAVNWDGTTMHFQGQTGGYTWHEVWSTANTTVDGNGFVKEASPIIKLFADKIEKNNLVADNVELTINSVGNYTISGSHGFAKKGWYIEQPKDANGNTKHYIEYQQDADETIHIQVYEPDYSTGRNSAGAPCNVVEGRHIDIRLHLEVSE